MKINKFLGKLTNKSVRKAMRHPSKANIGEVLMTAFVLYGIDVAARATTSGIVAGAKYCYNKITKKEKKNDTANK